MLSFEIDRFVIADEKRKGIWKNSSNYLGCQHLCSRTIEKGKGYIYILDEDREGNKLYHPREMSVAYNIRGSCWLAVAAGDRQSGGGRSGSSIVSFSNFLIMNTSTRNTTGIGWAADNAVAAGLSREEQRRRRGALADGVSMGASLRGGEREREKEKGWRRAMPGDFIGDVSIATARLIRRYELLLAA